MNLNVSLRVEGCRPGTIRRHLRPWLPSTEPTDQQRLSRKQGVYSNALWEEHRVP